MWLSIHLKGSICPSMDLRNGRHRSCSIWRSDPASVEICRLCLTSSAIGFLHPPRKSVGGEPAVNMSPAWKGPLFCWLRLKSRSINWCSCYAGCKTLRIRHIQSFRRPAEKRGRQKGISMDEQPQGQILRQLGDRSRRRDGEGDR